VVRFRELTLWDQYRRQIIAVLALARLNADQQRIMGEITTLNRRLISAQEDERRRIAMELHDDLSQQVTALSIPIRAKRRCLGVGPSGWISTLGLTP
jgi:signal transduction histidine kinase